MHMSDIQQNSTKRAQILEYALQGMTDKEIADKVACREKYVKSVLSSDQAIDFIEEFCGRRVRGITTLRALNTLETIAHESKSDQARVAAAKAILSFTLESREDAGATDPSQMTLGDIHKRIAELQASQAKKQQNIIDISPDIEPEQQ